MTKSTEDVILREYSARMPRRIRGNDAVAPVVVDSPAGCRGIRQVVCPWQFGAVSIALHGSTSAGVRSGMYRNPGTSSDSYLNVKAKQCAGRSGPTLTQSELVTHGREPPLAATALYGCGRAADRAILRVFAA